MNERNLFFAFLILISFNISAQKAEFGKFTQVEFDYKGYSDDPEASAVVLFDYGKADYIKRDNTLVIRFKRHTRIKILKESGLDQANITIPYYMEDYNNFEQVLDIKATNNSLSGVQIESQNVDKKSIVDEKINEYWRQRRFSIPGVKVGSIIEFSYTHITPFMFNITDWEFQREIPTLKSHFELNLVPFYEYIFVAQGNQNDLKHTSKIDHFERSFGGVKYKTMSNTFAMENIEAFYDDEYITSRDDYIRKIDFQLSKINYPNGTSKEVMTNWEGMANELLDHQSFGKYIKTVEKTAAKNLIPSLALNDKDELGKIQTVRDFVSSSYILNNFYGKYALQKPKELEKLKTGSVADINLYLIGVLRAAGFDVDPVILSTRAHGKVFQDYPISDRFNYVIAVVKLDNGEILIDATEPRLPYYLLPTRCLNGWGLRVKENPEWLNVFSSYYSNRTWICSMNLKEDSLISSIQEKSTHYDANSDRINFENDKGTFLSSKIANESIFLEVPEDFITDENHSVFRIKYVKTAPLEKFESEVFINPFENIDFEENPLKQKNRDYPVDFVYKKERNFQTTIHVPDYLKIKSIPNNSKISNAILDFDYEVIPLSENTLQIIANYKIKKSSYDPKEYNLLKSNLNYMIKTLNSQIVLNPSLD